MSAGLTPSAHHRFLLQKLERVTSGGITRLMVLMPPGSAKSTYTSVIFPVWWFMQHPRSSVIAASHTVGLVQHFSRRIRELIEENHRKTGFVLRKDDRSATHWQTSAGGEYFGVGVRGAIAGRRADLIIIDDPIRSMAEAENAKHRQHIWDWYTAELIARLKPGGRVVLVMTRWHEQDLGGQLAGQTAESWDILRLPAVAEEDDPIGRPPGAPLWPAWESGGALAAKQTIVGARTWSALFQQAPMSAASQLFDMSKLEIVEQCPRAIRTVRGWDLAGTLAAGAADPDWTAGVKLLQTESGQYVIADVVRFRGTFHAVQEMLRATAQTDGRDVVISLPIDPGQAGKGQASQLTGRLAGYRVYSSRENGSKLTRAVPVAAQLDAGNLAMLRGPWNQLLTREMETFPQGQKDDQVDALSRAFLTLCDMPAATRRLDLSIGVR